MANEEKNYYVYVYIDPRDKTEFYYGKGTGSRKYAHLRDQSASEKVAKIREIEDAGMSPIIKVIATDLTEHEALLVEKTLIWRLESSLTNISGGHFAENFRPQNSFDQDLPGFDFENDIVYVNVDEGQTRNWDDCRTFGFLSAGQGIQWRNQISRIQEGDLIIAYLIKHGYVGVGKALQEAVRLNDFRTADGLPIPKEQLVQPRLFDQSDSDEGSEYLIKVRWIVAVEREKAKWQKNAGLFTSQRITASLAAQPKTIQFIEDSFSISLSNLRD